MPPQIANLGSSNVFSCPFFHISGYYKSNIPIFPHFFHILQSNVNFLLASAEGRGGNREKEQDRDDNRNGRSPRGLLFPKTKLTF